MHCPSCDSTIPDRARFCPACGHAVHAHADERRVVTVVFADIVGFTGLAETRDPEPVKNLLDRLFARLAADVAEHGGRVDKVVGDALVALFGAPVAHEDDPERAVRAALRMQETVAATAGEVEAPIRLRVGVNTGEVLMGALPVGDDYTAMGDVVNTASRLQTVAKPGHVVVGPATHAATAGVVHYEPLGSIEVRGREEPVPAWLAVEVLAPPGTRPARTRAPLAGRDVELGVLDDVLSLAESRRQAQFVEIVGDAGLGKSRLAAEVASRAQHRSSVTVLEGRCLPYGEANEWWPIATAIRRLLALHGTEDTVEIRDACLAAAKASGSADPGRTAEGLAHLLAATSSLAGIEQTRAGDEVVRAVHEVLAARAETRPVVLILEDVHLATDAVLHLAARLLDGMRALPFVLLATSRDQVTLDGGGRHGALFLRLEPLEPEAAHELLGSLLEARLPATVRDALLDRAAGNPFYIEELVALFGCEGGARLTDLQYIPDSLRGLAAARLDSLGASERAVLQDAAVVGCRGPVAALDALATARGASPGDADAAVAALAARDLVRQDREAWEFRSEVLRDVAYATLTKADRARRHVAFADWQSEHPGAAGNAATHLATAAELAAELGRVDALPDDLRDRALRALGEAAADAVHVEDHKRAAELFDRALRLIADDAPKHIELLLGRAAGRMGIHDLPGARHDLEEVFEAVPTNSVEAATATSLIGELLQKEGRLDEAATTLDRAVDMWKALGDPRGKADALRVAGMTRLFRGDHAGAEETTLAALDAFTKLDDVRGRAWALQNLAWIAYMRNDTDLADERLDASAALFREIGDKGGLGWVLGLLAWVRLHQGRFEESEALVQRVLPETMATGDRWAHGMLLVALASIRLWTGRTTEAAQQATAAIGHFREIDDAFGLVQGLTFLARALAASGRTDEAFRVAEEAYAADSRMLGAERNRFVDHASTATAVHAGAVDRALAYSAAFLDADAEGVGSVAYGLAVAMSGRFEEAIDRLETVRLGALSTGSRPYATSALALVLAAAGRHEEALAEALGAEAEVGATYLDRFTAQLARGLAHARAGDPAAAEKAFRDAQENVDSTGDLVAQAVARLAEGHALGRPEVLADAGERIARMDLPPTGWESLIRAALNAKSSSDR